MANGINNEPALILLVDDDPADQELTRRSLQEGRIRTELRIVNDGQEALDYLNHRGKFQDPASSPRPDHLILLDLNMPRVDGRGVLPALREDSSLRMIPVVVLTTSGQEADVVGSYELGANSYIKKPSTATEFADVLATLETYWLQIVVLPPKTKCSHGE